MRATTASLDGHARDREARSRVAPVLAIALTALVIKLIQAALDPTPLFFLGDSWAYLGTSVVGTISEDRSWVYGFLARPFTVWTGTINGIVPAQALAGAATCALLARVLARDFGIRTPIVAVIVLGFAFEPLQVLEEHMVMTESFTGLVLAISIVLVFAFLERPRVHLLVWVALAGVGLVSLRTVYVPVALAGAAVLPMIALPGVRQAPHGLRALVSPVAVALLATAVFHLGYRQLTGYLSDRPPAYLHGDGFFIASAWWSILAPGDAIDPQAASLIERLKADPPDIGFWREAEFHRWRPEGFVPRLVPALGGDRVRANAVAKATATRAGLRDPMGVLRLTAHNFGSYWTLDETRIRSGLLLDQGAYNVATEPMSDFFRQHFDIDVARQTPTPSKWWHLRCARWYVALTLTPILCLGAASVCRPGARSKAVILSILSAALLATTCVAALSPVCRFLHPLVFPFAIAMGVSIQAAVDRIRSRG
jgi:hypothetical protein